MQSLVGGNSVVEVLRSPGHPLDMSTRAFMERRLGRDLSNVRVHTDSRAAASAEAENARAYTVGGDVVFGAGQYAPQTGAGKHLLAHELTHVMQQTSGSLDGDAEARARASADKVLRGESADHAGTGSATLSLQKAPKDAGPETAGAAPAAAEEAGSTEPPVDEFDFDKSTIPPQHLDRLAQLREMLINAPGARVVLTGHTDTAGSEKYNDALGLRRAAAVRDFLTTRNEVDAARIEIKSKGERQPAAGQPPAALDPGKGEKNPKNRRVEIRITGLPQAAGRDKGWTLDPADPSKRKKPEIDLKLPPDYKPERPPKTEEPPKQQPSASPTPEKEGRPEVETAVVLDPRAKSEPGSARASRLVETTVEVAWDAPSGLLKRLHSQISFTLHVGPNGFEEVEADLTAFKKKIKDTIAGGTVKDLTFSMGLNPGLNLDRSTATRLVTDFSVKAKASLEADLIIPKTPIKIPIEISGTVDVAGRPEFEAKFKVFSF